MKTSRKRLILPIVFLILTLALHIWIFSNSMKDAEESGEQSAQVVEVVKPVYEQVLPAVNVPPTYENITHYVRKTGHFAEFFGLGVLSLLTVWFFRPEGKKKGLYLLCPVLCFLTAAADEAIQLKSEGRGPQWSDVLLDFCGALTGILLAFLLALLFRSVRRKIRVKKEKKFETKTQPRTS